MRHSKSRSLAATVLGFLVFLLSLIPSVLQDRSGPFILRQPEIEGVYEMKTDGSQTIILQVYLKDGDLVDFPNRGA